MYYSMHDKCIYDYEYMYYVYMLIYVLCYMLIYVLQIYEYNMYYESNSMHCVQCLSYVLKLLEATN